MTLSKSEGFRNSKILVCLCCFSLLLNTALFSDKTQQTDPVKTQEETKPEKEKSETETPPTQQPAEPAKPPKTLKEQYHETIVVTGAMDEEYYWDTTTTMTVLDRNDLNDLMQITLGDTLRYGTSALVQTSGSIGKATSVRLHGASSNQTLLLLDGIPLNDPALGIPNFAPLSISGIGRLEILRGSHSPLYGSSASGGVINIISQEGEGDFHFTFYGEADNVTIYDGCISMSGRTGAFSYFTNYQTIRSDGGFENDNYKNNAFDIKLGYNFSETAKMTAAFHYIDSHIGIPIEVFGKQTFDVNSKQDDLSFICSLILDAQLFEKVDTRISLGLMSNRQKFKDPEDPGESFAFPLEIKTDSDIYNLNITNNINLSEKDILTVGFEMRELSADNKDILANTTSYNENLLNYGFYLQNRMNISDRIFLTASLRFDDFEKFGSSLNPRLAAAFLAGDSTKLTAAYSTGFRIPSLNELYYPYYGNQELEPEESRMLEFSFEQFLFNGSLRFGATGFLSHYTNLISYNYELFKADNIDEALINGIELSAEFLVDSGWSGCASYLYTYNEKNGESDMLLRLPKHQFSASLNWKTGSFQFGLLSRFVGEQFDNPVEGYPFFTEPYFVTDLHALYDIHEGVKLFSRFTNIFDADYYEVKGYPARGRQWFIGCSFR